MAITKRDLQKMAAKVIRENPDASNPMNSKEQCLYRNWSKTNPKRCIVGQIAYEFGLPLPGPKVVMGAHTVADVYKWDVTEAGAQYLDELQGVADMVSRDGGTWSEIINAYEPAVRMW